MNVQKSKLKMMLVTAFLVACFMQPVSGLVLYNYSDDIIKGNVRSSDNNGKEKTSNFQLGPRQKFNVNIEKCSPYHCEIHVENTGSPARRGYYILYEKDRADSPAALYGISPSKDKRLYNIRRS